MTVFDSPFAPIPLRDLTITERVFEGLASVSADTPVLTCGTDGHSLTASETMTAIRSLAGGLTTAGFGAGSVVALMAPNSPEFAVVFHGVLYAGGTVTTINPAYTAPEVAHQLRDSGVRLLVTASDCVEAALAATAGTDIKVVVIGGADGATALDHLMGAPLAAQVPVDLDRHVAALPYSSGTTGLPKGVMLSHRNLVINIDQTLAVHPVTADDATVAFLPFFHIYGLTVLMNLYLGVGARLVTMPRFDLPRFLELVQAHRTRVIYCVPPVALALARHPLVDDYDVSSLGLVLSAAAPLGAATTDAIAARLNCVGVQGYGMTELSPVSHFSGTGVTKPGACGVPLPNTATRIVDPETGQDLGIGETGELWVKGPQVMMGYLNRPEATADTMAEGGWLRTGDLASVDAEGFLFIHDRLKELIKVKGFQVAPAEVEAVLLEHPAILDAAVLGRGDANGEEVPVAYVVCEGGTLPEAGSLAAHLEARLAHYKHPAQMHVVDAIPKSASGKILRRVLRDVPPPAA